MVNYQLYVTQKLRICFLFFFTLTSLLTSALIALKSGSNGETFSMIALHAIDKLKCASIPKVAGLNLSKLANYMKTSASLQYVCVIAAISFMSEAFVRLPRTPLTNPKMSWRSIKTRPYSAFFMSKGFGAPKKAIPVEPLTPTRPTDARKVIGAFSKILAKYCEQFESMRSRGVPVANDLYARMSNSDIFYFIGKMNHGSELNTQEAFDVIMTLLKEYAKSIRPRELAGPAAARGELQIWSAPGNSEMDCARNKISLLRVVESASTQAIVSGDIISVGYEPEIYQGGEEGFRIKRSDLGEPLAAEFDVTFKSPDEVEGMKKD
jgi:hypothetical protein